MRKLLVLSSQTLGGPVTLQLRRRNWQLDRARSGSQARQLLAQKAFLVGLSVFWDEDTDEHCAALAAIIADYPDIRWVAALPRDAVQRESCAALIATGLYDYFSLPLEAERLSVILGHAYGMTEVGIRFLQQQQSVAAGRFGMLGRSPAMRGLFRNMEWAAESDAPVIIIGEIGTRQGDNGTRHSHQLLPRKWPVLGGQLRDDLARGHRATPARRRRSRVRGRSKEPGNAGVSRRRDPVPG